MFYSIIAFLVLAKVLDKTNVVNKIVDIIPTTVIRGLNAKEVKTVPDDSIYIGTYMADYGDWQYYITTDGEVVCTYYSIGD